MTGPLDDDVFDPCRVLDEGAIEDFDGFDVLTETELDSLEEAIVTRPDVCGFNAFHTSGGMIPGPSTMPDSELPPGDLWTWKELAEIATGRTGYPSGSIGLTLSASTDRVGRGTP